MTGPKTTESRVDQGELLQLTTEIVAAHVSKSAVPQAELPELIVSVLSGISAHGTSDVISYRRVSGSS